VNAGSNCAKKPPRNRTHNGYSNSRERLTICFSASNAAWTGLTIRLHMTINELRDTAEGLAKRARRVAAGRKRDSIHRGWLAIERPYGNAKDTLPSTVIGLSLQGEVETWTNVARLASAIVTACDHCELPSRPNEVSGDSAA
jgi:hypothetical protein